MNTIGKLSLMIVLATAFMAGCSGSNGKTGPTGPTGATGATGSAGPTDPTISWIMPEQGASNVYIDSVIKVGFSKPMNSTTINSSTFSVSTEGIAITGSISYNSGSQTAFFDPNVPLSQFAFYTATLTTGIKDLSGNPLPANYSWTFASGGSSTPSDLYVSNGSTNSIDVFNNASITQGNVTPDRIISGATTTLSQPYGIWYDPASDRLYVINHGSSSILVFDNASTINGNVAPNRTISGAATGLNRPFGIWYDSASDSLYVANGIDSILVFDNASTINGNVAPSRTISGAATGLNGPASLWYDSTSDRLSVANDAGSILVFDNASTINGNVAPSRTISGANTGFNETYGIWYDSTADRLYVVNYLANSISVFDDASTINGDIAPSRTISGAATGLYGPVGIWYDSASDRLYVANWLGNSILVFDDASTINGNVAPSRTISGVNTGLSETYGIWLNMNP